MRESAQRFIFARRATIIIYKGIAATRTGQIGINMTASGVKIFILRYKLNGSIASTGSFPARRKLSLQAHKYIDYSRGISAPQLQKKMLDDFGTVSARLFQPSAVADLSKKKWGSRFCHIVIVRFFQTGQSVSPSDRTYDRGGEGGGCKSKFFSPNKTHTLSTIYRPTINIPPYSSSTYILHHSSIFTLTFSPIYSIIAPVQSSKWG